MVTHALAFCMMLFWEYSESFITLALQQEGNEASF